MNIAGFYGESNESNHKNMIVIYGAYGDLYHIFIINNRFW